jgi:hypothetical protein
MRVVLDPLARASRADDSDCRNDEEVESSCSDYALRTQLTLLVAKRPASVDYVEEDLWSGRHQCHKA